MQKEKFRIYCTLQLQRLIGMISRPIGNIILDNLLTVNCYTCMWSSQPIIESTLNEISDSDVVTKFPD